MAAACGGRSDELKSHGFTIEECTLQGTNISPQKWHFEDDFPFPKVGYVNSLEGIQRRTGVCFLRMMK